MSGIQQLLLGGPFGAGAQGDPNWQNVTLLSGTTTTNAGQNNTFLDSSSNNFTITRDGNTTQGSFSPFSQAAGYWGVYFDGDADVVKLPSESAFGLGTGNFTIELWVNFSDYYASQCRIAGQYSNGTTNGWQIYKDPNSYVIRFNTNVGDHVTYTWYPSIGQWNHFAIVRSGTGAGQTKMYINGQEVASGTMSYSIVANQLIVGGLDWAANYSVNGYISNFRYSNIARTITVPTTPYSSDANTLAILCQSNRFIETSANKTVTVVGTPFISPLQPFGAPTSPYSTTNVGGSGYYDGSVDRLSITGNTAFDISTGDFTVEGWVYPLSNATFQAFFSLFTATNSNFAGLTIYLSRNTNGTLICGGGSPSVGGGSAAFSITTTNTVLINTWSHFAVTRNGNTFTVWINGVSSGTATFSGTLYWSPPNLYIGNSNNSNPDPLNGYLSNFRIVKGTAVYTTGFTPPTTPVTAISGTGVLCNFTNANIYDQAVKNDLETAGNAQVSTSVKKFGDSSAYFDGTGDYLLPSCAAEQFTLGGEFTIEFWMYPTTVSGYSFIMDCRPSPGEWIIDFDAGKIGWIDDGANVRIQSPAVTVNQWCHVAINRSGGSTKMFVNGNQVGSTYANTDIYYSTTNRPCIGGSGLNLGTFNWAGYLSDIRITKGLGRYPYNFTPPTTSLPNFYQAQTLTADPYFDYTTLLLPGSGTNGAQNNTFTDSSTNAFTITRNGNTTQGTFSPFSQTGWSNYFDGNDYLSGIGTTSSFNFMHNTTALFTFECWVYVSSTAAAQTLIDNTSGTSSQIGCAIYVDAGGTVSVFITRGVTGVPNVTAYVTSSGTVAVNQWNHIAVTYDQSLGSNNAKFYINGASAGQGSKTGNTPSSSNASNAMRIGTYGAGAGDFVTGYISNLRISNSIVYSAAFTPSTSPLTTSSQGATSVALLTCQSNRFVDNSSNAFAITVNGNPSVQAFSPFAPTAAYSAGTNGGSGYFDGTGDYLSVAGATALNYGSGDFTIECWYYPTSTSNGEISAQGDGALPGSTYEIKFRNAGYLTINMYSTAGGVTVSFNTSKNWVLNAWNHVAVVRNGNTVTCYMDGVSAGTGDATGASFGVTDNVYVGAGLAGGNVYKGGYIANFRIVKGTAVYTTGFTPPTAPLTAISGTSLLSNFTNAGITDATAKNDWETVGNAQISNGQAKWGSTSMYFDGNGDYLVTRPTDLTNFGSGDFTVESWVRLSALNAFQGIYDRTLSSTSGFGGTWLRVTDANKFMGAFSSGTSSHTLTITGTTTVTTGVWYHVAWVRYGSTFTLYVNGNSEGTATSSATMSSAGDLVNIGTQQISGSPANQLNGYLQDLRVTKGIARYTQNFTPPTAAFQLL